MNRIAIIQIPSKILLGGNIFHTLHGYWIPPHYVIEYWSTGCKIPYTNETEYEQKKQEVLQSQMECINQYYKDNAL